MEEHKVIAYCPLHYGAEYLSEAIKAVAPVVDRIYIIYTEKPSFGFKSGIKCPESKELLKKIAYEAEPDKLMFVTVNGINAENMHRKFVQDNFAGGDVDLIVAFDADEVWDTEYLRSAIEHAKSLPNKYIQVSGFINFWRSFNTVCLDHFQPVRFVNMRYVDDMNQGVVSGKIYHFSLAQSEEIVRYKWSIHGHLNELRPNWLEGTYFGWDGVSGDLHPTSIGLWNPAPFDKTTLPELLKQHKNYNKQVI